MRLHGCHNHAPPVDEVVVREGFHPSLLDGCSAINLPLLTDIAKLLPKRVAYPNRAKKDCQYTLSDLGKKDDSCHLCIWRAPYEA